VVKGGYDTVSNSQVPELESGDVTALVGWPWLFWETPEKSSQSRRLPLQLRRARTTESVRRLHYGPIKSRALQRFLEESFIFT
jgi:hypothetical protein